MSEKLEQGIYEDLLTESLQEQLSLLDDSETSLDIRPADKAIIGDYLTRTLSESIRSALRLVSDKDNVLSQYELANKIIDTLSSHTDKLLHLSKEKYILSQNNLLSEIKADTTPSLERPTTPLITPSLFTGAAGSPQLGKELELEFASADRVDMLISFIKSAGVNLIFPALKEFTGRGGKLRIITTTYLGASDPSAVNKLKSLPNTEIKISYDTKHSRLHAKAYFIHRNSGHSCAYIGSANLSHAAMTSGLEWTVKLPFKELPSLFRRCEAQFETYWDSAAFKEYNEEDYDYLRKTTAAEKYSKSKSTSLTMFELRPYEHQRIVLDELSEARSDLGNFRNLVVAATGTGKTMIAAFDYKRQCVASTKPRLLFLAHRKEILRQARNSFRHVLSDGNFGEELYDSKHPENIDYLFASVASFNSRKLTEQYGTDYWDFVILDEAHHGKAQSYRSILTELKPKILLGLTATPERTDGSSIAEDFDYPIASEIRLPEAMQQKLLCPFHYYAISDHTVDFSSISWKQGRFDKKELSKLVTGNTARINLIIKKVIEYFPAPLDSEDFDRENLKAIGFCVSQDHAKEMAEQFSKAGIEARALDANSSSDYREETRELLQKGKINFVFTVDLFNEGIDIPAVNGILFLRPTESHVVFQQQLGRGLRNFDGKDQLVVLDFVGTVHNKFRFDLRLKSLLPGKRHDIKKEIEHGFPHLPAGSYIHFEKTARDLILKNIRQTYKNIETRVLDSFSSFEVAPTFSEYISRTKESPTELLSKHTWSNWKKMAGFNPRYEYLDLIPEKNSLARASMVNDPHYLESLLKFIDPQTLNIENVLESSPYTGSAYYLLWNKNGKTLGLNSYADAFEAIRKNIRYREELYEVLKYAQLHQLPISSRKHSLSKLRLYAKYTMREITAMYGKATLDTTGPTGTGVVHVKEEKAYLHLVTFDKDEKLFSESNRYRDFLSARDILHWESQSSTSQQSKTGQNYIHHENKNYHIHFFARIKKSEGKLTSPFTYLGEATFIKAEGDRPISINWKLKYKVSHQFFNEAKVAAGIS